MERTFQMPKSLKNSIEQIENRISIPTFSHLHMQSYEQVSTYLHECLQHKIKNDIIIILEKSCGHLYKQTIPSLSILTSNKDNLTCIEDEIHSIKKQLKYCKSSLESKHLNQRLNTLYKDKKKEENILRRK